MISPLICGAQSKACSSFSCDKVLIDALRVGKKVIVGFPNFSALQYQGCDVFSRGERPSNRFASLPMV